MDFTLQKETLVDGIQTVQNAVTQKSSLPILANVLLETAGNELKLTATDLDIGICSNIPLIAGEEGAITVPAKKFFDIIRSLPDGSDINITIKKNNSITIKSGKALFKIIGLPKEDFPALPVFEDKASITIDQKILKEMLNLTDFAISKEDARHILTGILFAVKGEDISVVATDGRRMAVINKKLGKKTLVDREVVIPYKAVQEVKRMLGDQGDITVKFSDNQVMFILPASFIISRLIEGEYPDYGKVIPKKSGQIVTVQRDSFLSAARRVSILTDQDSQAVKLNIQKTKMTISKNTPYLGEAKEEISAEYSGDKDLEIGFNPKYLIDVLRNLEEDDILFEVNDQNKPGVIRKGEEYTYVVLPMQLAA